MPSTSDAVRYYEAVPRLASGCNLFEDDRPVTASTLKEFRVKPSEIRAAETALRAIGLTPIAANEFTITVRVEATRPEEAFGQMQVGGATHLSVSDAVCRSQVGGLAAVPRTEVNVTPIPPPAGYFHLRAPTDLRVGLNGETAANAGWTGRGTHIAAVDSGCYTEHPFFRQRDAQITVVPGPDASDLQADTLGHGTMICGTIVSLAPETRITMIKTPDQASLAGFKQAVSLRPLPDIIQNTWGHETDGDTMTAYDRAVHAAVLDAIGKGCLVVFAGGNAKILFPPQIPEAIGVGGAYMDEQGQILASTYASGYASAIFDGRIMPDFCGLVGPWPNGVYIALPTAPGSIIDTYFAERPFPNGDGGIADDGWVVISGTSSASAQVSGTVALLRQIDPQLEQAAARHILARTAKRVNIGTSAQGSPSGPPFPNLATGFGLVDVGRAIEMLTGDAF